MNSAAERYRRASSRARPFETISRSGFGTVPGSARGGRLERISASSLRVSSA